MDKRRSVKTRIWGDQWVESLAPLEKLLFVYLLTNDQTNLLGIYEISINRICFETGLEKGMVLNGLKSFETVRKAFFIDGYVVLPNFFKNQDMNKNMIIGAKRLFDLLPESLKLSLNGINIESFETLSNHSESLGNHSGIEIEREIEIENIISAFNEITGKRVKLTKPREREISGRLKEGHTLEEFKTVIKRMNDKWKDDPKMRDYITPDTLFRASHFQKYLEMQDGPIKYSPTGMEWQ